MSRQFWSETLVWTTADGTAVANSTTETLLFTAPTIPANLFSDGRTFRLRAIGKYSTTGTPTMIFGLRYGTATGGVMLCKTAACTTPSGVTNAMWDLDITGTVRTNGAAGTIMANGTARVFAAVAGTVASTTGAGLVTPMTNGVVRLHGRHGAEPHADLERGLGLQHGHRPQLRAGAAELGR